MQSLFRTLFIPTLALALLGVACGKKPAENSSTAKSVSIVLGATPELNGLLQVNTTGDGRTQEAQAGGKDCQQLILKEGRPAAYLYIRVDPAFKTRPLPPLTLTVEYFDAMPTSFSLDYDSAIEGKNSGAYTPSKERIQTKGLQEWQEAKFVLDRPQLAGRENDHADFRLRVNHSDNLQFFVRSVTLSKD